MLARLNDYKGVILFYILLILILIVVSYHNNHIDMRNSISTVYVEQY